MARGSTRTESNGGSSAGDEYDSQPLDRTEQALDDIATQVAVAWYAVGLLSGAIMKHREEWGESHSKSLMEVQSHVQRTIVGPFIYSTPAPTEEEE